MTLTYHVPHKKHRSSVRSQFVRVCGCESGAERSRFVRVRAPSDRCIQWLLKLFSAYPCICIREISTATTAEQPNVDDDDRKMKISPFNIMFYNLHRLYTDRHRNFIQCDTSRSHSSKWPDTQPDRMRIARARECAASAPNEYIIRVCSNSFGCLLPVV